MSYFNIIAQSSESTVVTEYKPQAKRSEAYQSEADLEQEFIRLLCELGYERLTIHKEADLIANLRTQLEKLNNYRFTDDEWKRFWDEVLANTNSGILEKTRLIQEDYVQVLRRDNGAANTYIRSGRMPEAIVGDGDSLLPGIKERYASLIHSETEQETNDLSKAFRFCLSQERKRITIMGATGKREDHTIGNVSLLADYMEKAEVNMMTDYGIFVPIKEDSMFESYIGQQISIFNMNSTVLFAEGLAYPLSVFTNWWQGTLNEALAKHFIIRTEGKVLVFRTF